MEMTPQTTSHAPDPRGSGRRPGERDTARPGRPARFRWGVLSGMTMFTAAAVLVSGCSVLGLDESGPADATVTTSAATVAATGASTGVITAPVLGTGTTSAAPAPTPWQSLVSTSTTPTTSEAPLTAPTTTKTLTFTSLAPVTNPTIAAATAVVSPPPDCYTKGTCGSQAWSPVGSGKIEIVIPPGRTSVDAVLTMPGHPKTGLPIPWVASPIVTCAGSYCLVQGSNYNLYFGTLIKVGDGTMTAIPGTPSSTTKMRLLTDGPLVVAGTYRFDSYGVGPDDSPVSSRTWAISGGQLASTGCGAPHLYASPPPANAAQSGPCTGTPVIAGYSGSSGNKMVTLGGFITPSGNILCALLPGDTLACSAKDNTVKYPTCPEPESELPAALRGLRVMIAKNGRVSYDGCLGYTLIGTPATKISYRRLAVGHGFVCEVLQDGVNCTGPTGHGFSLSRSSLTTH